MPDDMRKIKNEVRGILEQIEKLPDEEKRIILASLKGMLLVANVNKVEG